MRQLPVWVLMHVPMLSRLTMNPGANTINVLKDQGITGYVDTVLNHTLIDKQTNIRINKKAPSLYISEMRAELGDRIDEVIRSHGLPCETDGPLLPDDYDRFLDWRRVYLEGQLREVTVWDRLISPTRVPVEWYRGCAIHHLQAAVPLPHPRPATHRRVCAPGRRATGRARGPHAGPQ